MTIILPNDCVEFTARLTKESRIGESVILYIDSSQNIECEIIGQINRDDGFVTLIGKRNVKAVEDA